MHIGELRKRVTIQAEAPTSDSGGGYALAWTDIATVWAEIVPIGGDETFTSQHLEEHVTHRVIMRYRSDIAITTDMRLVYGSRVFNIRAVLNREERNQWRELLAQEGGAT